MNKIAIKKGQIWRHKVSGDEVIVKNKRGGDWNIVLLDKPSRNSTSSHKVAPTTLWTKFILYEKEK